MRTKEYKVYKFDELPEESKQKALKKYHDINTDHDWWDYIYESWTEKLKELGYDEIEINFSGFYSQGDGASFTADVDVQKWLKAHKLASKYPKLYQHGDDIKIWVDRTDHHYSHKNTVHVAWENWSEELTPKDHDKINEIAELMEAEKNELCENLYRELETDYETLTSYAEIAETLRANEYELTIEGEIDTW